MTLEEDEKYLGKEGSSMVIVANCSGLYSKNSDRQQSARFEVLKNKQGIDIGAELKYCLAFNRGDRTCDNCDRDYADTHQERLKCKYADVYDPLMVSS